MPKIYELKSGRETQISVAFPFLKERGHVISLVGAGGKTSLMFCLAEQCASYGMRVLVSTTTHIRRPLDGSYVESAEQAEKRWEKGGIVVVGEPAEQGKLRMLPGELLKAYMSQADITFLEADGSREHPLKVPSQKEPVLIPESDIVIGVAGLGALGKPFSQACFRLEEAESFLGKSRQDMVCEEDIIRILTSERGSRKYVGERAYYMVLNQCDDKERLEQAKRIAQGVRARGWEQIAATRLSEKKN